MHYYFQTSLFAVVLLQIHFGSCNPVLAKAQDPGADLDGILKFSIGLAPGDPSLLERTLLELSDPVQPRYGQYLSREEAKLLVSPHEDSVTSVKRWLAEAGIPEDDIKDRGLSLEVKVVSSRARQLLYHLSFHGKPLKRSGHESVPNHIRRHITTIQPITNTKRQSGKLGIDKRTSPSSPRKGIKQTQENTQLYPVDLESCKSKLTPACIRKIYRIGNTYADPSQNTLVGVAGFDGQAAQRSQLARFVATFAPYANGANFSDVSINGGENPQGNYPSSEGNLDTQIVASLGYNVKFSFLSTGGYFSDYIPDLDLPSGTGPEPYLEFVQYLVDLPDEQLPQVISSSYGVNEQLIPKPYARQVCNLFGVLGARGVSVVIASGDTGVGISCQKNDGKNTTSFLPIFPASCPYVTAVGATESNSPEVGAEFSSGGFSEYWSTPSWQAKATAKYLANHGSEWKGYYNPRGRGYPDVAALGRNYQIYDKDAIDSADGTSASAPTFAAIIALLNNLRAQRGKPALGFLNPWLYQSATRGFTDITGGKSTGCPGYSIAGLPAPYVPGAGFAAVQGWDPVTGLGTPLFDGLRRSVGV